jgi:hypothetical protein
MRLRFEPRPELPVLAWCARVEPGAGEVRVLHGAGVDTRADGFVEGPWNGSFEAFDFLDATVHCGTGGRTRGDRMRFAGSSDRQAPIYSVAVPGALFVSNSATFALVAAGEEPDPLHPFYNYDVIAIWRAGLHCPDGRLPLRSGRTLGIHLLAILEVDGRGRVSFSERPRGPAPADYRSYRELLRGAVEDVFRNAAAPGRALRLEPLATISRGYDSTAAAVLAGEAGCREAMTFLDPRRPDPHDDSGAETARRLGMACSEHDRWAYLAGDGSAERETSFLAYPTGAAWHSTQDRLRGSLLVTGSFGEMIWDELRSVAVSEFAMSFARWPGVFGRMDLRLRVGYAIFALPYVAGIHTRAIHGITLSPEMAPWRLGGSYDRPIPRRIAEEAGLPRESFGMEKLGTSHVALISRRRFSEKGWADYQAFVARSHAGEPARRRLAARLAVAARHGLWRTLSSDRRRRHVPSTPLMRRLPFVLNGHPWLLPWPLMFTLQWTFDSTRERYRVASAWGSVRGSSAAC